MTGPSHLCPASPRETAHFIHSSFLPRFFSFIPKTKPILKRWRPAHRWRWWWACNYLPFTKEEDSRVWVNCLRSFILWSVQPRLEPPLDDTKSCAFPPFLRGASLSSIGCRGQGEGGRENMLWALAASLELADLARILTLENAVSTRVKKPLIYFIVPTHELCYVKRWWFLSPQRNLTRLSL